MHRFLWVAATPTPNPSFTLDFQTLIVAMGLLIAYQVAKTVYNKKKSDEILGTSKENYQVLADTNASLRVQRDELKGELGNVKDRLSKAEAKVEALQEYIMQYGSSKAFESLAAILKDNSELLVSNSKNIGATQKALIQTQKQLSQLTKAVNQIANKDSIHVESYGPVLTDQVHRENYVDEQGS